MKDIVGKMKTFSEEEIQEVMDGVQAWYREVYPDWDVMYMAVPKEPKARKAALHGMVALLKKDLAWNKKKYMEKQKRG